MRERLAEFVGVAVIALLLIVTVILFAGRDYKGPVISFASDVIYYDNADEAILMTGVTAYDSKDGDVTDSILIDSIIVLEGKSSVKVIYIAKDSSNNITKVERFIDYESDGSAEVTTDNNTQDSTIEDNKQDESGSLENESTGEGETEENGKDETETESVTEGTEPETTTTAPETTTAAPETTAAATNTAPVMVLKATEVTISVGGNFRVFDYVENITDDKDARDELFRQISVDGYYDTATVGDYEIYIFCVDSDRKASNKEKFIIHVREEEQQQ